VKGLLGTIGIKQIGTAVRFCPEVESKNMNTENPYQPSEFSQPWANTNLKPSNRTLWKAYILAPAVAPIAFVALVLLVGFLSLSLGADVNEASILVLPVLALTVGVVACYLVAGVIGMPIAFYLRRINLLNAYSIHGAAFCWAALFTSACAFYLVDGEWSALPLAYCYVGLGVIPPVMLSGTTFWLLLRFFSRRESRVAIGIHG